MQPEWRIAPIFIFGLLTVGCETSGPNPQQISHQSFKGTTLRVACDDPTGRELLRNQGVVWARETGAALELIDAPFGSPAATGADLGLIAPPELGDHAEAGRLAPVPPEFLGVDHPIDWSKLWPAYRDRLSIWEDARRPLAIPVLGEARVFVYRSDLFDAADIGEPKTWEDVAAAAARLTADRGVPALPPLPASDAELERLFFTVAAPYDRRARSLGDVRSISGGDARTSELFSFHFDLGTMEPRIEGPAFVHALEWFRKTAESRPGEPADEPWRAFVRGEAVMGVVPLTAVARAQENPEVADRFAIAPIPGSRLVFGPDGEEISLTGEATSANRVPYFGQGGLIGVVRSDTANASAAFDLLLRLGGPAVSTATVAEPLYGGGPFRTSHTDEVHQPVWYAYGLDSQRTGQLIRALKEQAPGDMGNPVFALRIPRAAAYVASFGAAARAAIAGEAEGLAGAAEAWELLDAGTPADQRRRAYRVSLGLGR